MAQRCHLASFPRGLTCLTHLGSQPSGAAQASSYEEKEMFPWKPVQIILFLELCFPIGSNFCFLHSWFLWASWILMETSLLG